MYKYTKYTLCVYIVWNLYVIRPNENTLADIKNAVTSDIYEVIIKYRIVFKT